MPEKGKGKKIKARKNPEKKITGKGLE